ncbi:hypothetical protein [Pseudorhodoplanes sinuspersici]|nr:hypothetical protein [Pseudorhodoplanes sinuspersici]RKE65766.1 hypothetical protein DFP91_5809 [Pseudorhodoplanes sinuspersici]
MVDQIAKNRADVHFKVRERQKVDTPLARMEYEAAGVALRENTARLRALRLARDANRSCEKTRLRNNETRRSELFRPRTGQKGNQQ